MEQQIIEMQTAIQKIKEDFNQFKADEFVMLKEEYEEKSESYDEQFKKIFKKINYES